jgi:hypothetical protein
MTRYDSIQGSEQQTSTVTLTILPVCHLGITDADVSETIVQATNANETFSKGGIEFAANKPTLQINSNQGWKLTVKSSDFSGPYDKDIKDLMLKDSAPAHVKNGFFVFKALSAYDQVIASSDVGVREENHPLQYKVLLDWEKDVPGTYTITVTYTLSTNTS